MHNEELQISLESVLNHIQICKNRFLKIQKPDDFVLTDEGSILLDSIVARLQAIGELVKKISNKNPSFILKHSEINWTNIIRFRDFISHHYDLLDYEIVFEICSNNLIELEAVLILELKSQ